MSSLRTRTKVRILRDKSKLLRTNNISKCQSKVPDKLEEEEELSMTKTSINVTMPPKEKTLTECLARIVEKTLNKSLKSMDSVSNRRRSFLGRMPLMTVLMETINALMLMTANFNKTT